MSKIRKPVENAQRKKREAQAQAEFDRNILKEREIGVHPQYRNNQSKFSAADVKAWEKKEKQWEKSHD